MRPPPTTAEYVEMWAARTPHQVALREAGQDLAYARLHHLLRHCALELRRMGLEPGQRVAVAGPGVGIALVVLLAAEGLGLVTVSFDAEEDPDAAWLFDRVDAVFAGRPQAVPAGVQFRHMDAGFVRRLWQPLPEAPPDWRPGAWDAPQRITRTAGSSGPSKFMLLDRAAQEWQVRSGDESWPWVLDADTRMLLLMPLLVNAGYSRVAACLRRGGTVLHGPGAEIAALAPTCVVGLTAQLERLLRALPADYRAPRPVTVAAFGAMPPPALRERLLAVFGGALVNRYGGNEAGGLCDLDAQGVGVLRAGVEVRILDEAGRVLPPGEEGVVAVRTPALVQGYLELPHETAAAFRDGWFVSADVGMLLGERLLKLLGRHDDLVNLGGIKVPAARLEVSLRAQPAILECAVQAMQVDDGAVSLGVALVCAPGATHDVAAAQLRAALANWSETQVRVVFVDALPMTTAGKVDRMRLRRLFTNGFARP
ncbi:MAG TPA: class I adenylate-forming enzyme family protein [Ramlibacter sp.]|jgi:malonyl-CoA/methylmalonyl-CoA synthetase